MNEINEKELRVRFSNEKANAYLKFHNLLNDIKIKYSDYLKENELEFESIYNFIFTEYDVGFYITNQSVLNTPLKADLDSAFSESFSKLFKKG